MAAERIYICHTFYHVYISHLKELALEDRAGGADIMLSSMSTDFGQLGSRIEKEYLFEKVIAFDEKREDFFPELAPLRRPGGGFLGHLWKRMRFTREYARLEAPYVPVDLRAYKQVYVFCDSDPIGYYLNQNRIYYHALEDGLDCLVHLDAARYDNRGHFWLKAFLSKYLNLLFVQNGYGRYCLDMEVNSIGAISHACKYYKEVPRRPLEQRLGREERELLLRVFVEDQAALEDLLRQEQGEERRILILTEPLCDLDTRRRIFGDLIEAYAAEGRVFLKGHPRDALDYRQAFPHIPQIPSAVPMEVLNLLPGCSFHKAVGVLTQMGGIGFAREVCYLGADFLDKYEEPSIHRQNEYI